jgi:hypothetical protein
MWNERDKIGEWMKKILKGVDEGWVRPHVDRTLLFEQAGEAHAYIEARNNIGKIAETKTKNPYDAFFDLLIDLKIHCNLPRESTGSSSTVKSRWNTAK